MRYALASSSWSLGIFLQQPPPIIRLCLRDCHPELLLKYSENYWILKYNRISEYTAASTSYWPFCVTYCEAFEVFWPDYFVTVNSLSIFLRYSTIISTKPLYPILKYLFEFWPKRTGNLGCPPVYLHLIFEISSVTRFFFNFKISSLRNQKINLITKLIFKLFKLDISKLKKNQVTLDISKIKWR